VSSLSAVPVPRQLPRLSSVEFYRGRSLDPFSSFLYTADLVNLVKSYDLNPHLYVDDTQIYGFSQPATTDELQSRVSRCISAVGDWMSSITACSWTPPRWRFSGARLAVARISCQQSLAMTRCHLSVQSGIFASMSTLTSQCAHTCWNDPGCFTVLRRIKSIRRSVSTTVRQSLMLALVLSRLDYGSTVLASLPKQLLDRLQSVQNAAARLVFAARHYDHNTPLLHTGLWVAEGITFWVAGLQYCRKDRSSNACKIIYRSV